MPFEKDYPVQAKERGQYFITSRDISIPSIPLSAVNCSFNSLEIIAQVLLQTFHWLNFSETNTLHHTLKIHNRGKIHKTAVKRTVSHNAYVISALNRAATELWLGFLIFQLVYFWSNMAIMQREPFKFMSCLFLDHLW